MFWMREEVFAHSLTLYSPIHLLYAVIQSSYLKAVPKHDVSIPMLHCGQVFLRWYTCFFLPLNTASGIYTWTLVFLFNLTIWHPPMSPLDPLDSLWQTLDRHGHELVWAVVPALLRDQVIHHKIIDSSQHKIMHRASVWRRLTALFLDELMNFFNVMILLLYIKICVKYVWWK